MVLFSVGGLTTSTPDAQYQHARGDHSNSDPLASDRSFSEKDDDRAQQRREVGVDSFDADLDMQRFEAIWPSYMSPARKVLGAKCKHDLFATHSLICH